MKTVLVSGCALVAGVSFLLAQMGPRHGRMMGGRMGMMHGFRPLPASFENETNPATQAKVELGRMLYFEKRLSKSGQFSCNSCHDLATYGVDNQPTSTGHNGQKGSRNSPTVYNAAGEFAQFWDGRAQTVEEQAKGPMLNPVEMALVSGDEAAAILKRYPEYVRRFREAFPGEADAVTFDNAARAIGAFERKLVTPSKWDRFLKGDQDALTEQERMGFHTFMHTGCASCHSGTLVGGGSFQKLGAEKAYPDSSDTGRHQVTKNAQDRMMFKVPSLRNVEKTGPYFHNGKVGKLEEAVAQMAEYQLGTKLKQEEVESIVAWLKTLTGAPPAELIREPKLP